MIFFGVFIEGEGRNNIIVYNLEPDYMEGLLKGSALFSTNVPIFQWFSAVRLDVTIGDSENNII